MSTRHAPFLATILAMCLFLGGFVLYQEHILTTGQIVILETRPVDPRDLFRGEYVILRYTLESDWRLERLAQELPEGSLVHVMLAEDQNGVSHVAEATQWHTTGRQEGIWITGEVRNGQVRFPSLEQFYVPEGAGRNIEALRNGLYVEVAVREGDARVTRLLDALLTPIDPVSYREDY